MLRILCQTYQVVATSTAGASVDIASFSASSSLITGMNGRMGFQTALLIFEIDTAFCMFSKMIARCGELPQLG